ncbi:MAG: hypothetical protein HYV03_01370 [Deltaproteobacteria bacterium]|nr:hypothetical protein [Deltaproteobacteria bacterium]
MELTLEHVQMMYPLGTVEQGMLWESQESVVFSIERRAGFGVDENKDGKYDYYVSSTANPVVEIFSLSRDRNLGPSPAGYRIFQERGDWLHLISLVLTGPHGPDL